MANSLPSSCDTPRYHMFAGIIRTNRLFQFKVEGTFGGPWFEGTDGCRCSKCIATSAVIAIECLQYITRSTGKFNSLYLRVKLQQGNDHLVLGAGGSNRFWKILGLPAPCSSMRPRLCCCSLTSHRSGQRSEGSRQ
jgi:hypothetical protein